MAIGNSQEGRRERRKSSLPAAQQRLIELLQQMNFGCIEGLAVVDRQPILDPPPRIIEERKFGAVPGPRPEARLDDFVLKAQQDELIQSLDEIGTGTIASLTIQAGLPFLMRFERRR